MIHPDNFICPECHEELGLEVQTEETKVVNHTGGYLDALGSIEDYGNEEGDDTVDCKVLHVWCSNCNHEFQREGMKLIGPTPVYILGDWEWISAKEDVLRTQKGVEL